MSYEVISEYGLYMVNMHWPDGENFQYGPFNSSDKAHGFADGFIAGIDCHM